MLRLIFALTLLTPLLSLAQQAQCPKGYQPYASRCVTQRMADYISCLEASGGNKQSISEELSQIGGNKLSGDMKVSGGNAVVKGAGAITLDKQSESALIKRLETKWFSGGISECAKALRSQNSNKAHTESQKAANTEVGSVVIGSGNTVIQGSNNMVVTKTPSTLFPSFASIKVTDVMYPTDKPKEHHVHYMTISGMEASNLQAKTNHLLKRSALSLYEKYANWDEVDIGYKVGFTEFNLLGLNTNIMIYGKGAAHPLTTTLALVVNLETAELFELKDLFRSGYQNNLNRIVAAKLKQMRQFFPCKTEESDTDEETRKAGLMLESFLGRILGHDAKTCFAGTSDDGQFYLTDTSIVLVFPQYSIASGASGDIEVRINYEELQGMFNPNGPLRRFL